MPCSTRTSLTICVEEAKKETHCPVTDFVVADKSDFDKGIFPEFTAMALPSFEPAKVLLYSRTVAEEPLFSGSFAVENHMQQFCVKELKL